MDKSQRNKILYQASVTFAALAMSIAFFFVLYRMGHITKALGKIWDALGPFVYGAAIAYVLGPACDFFESLFEKLFIKLKCKNPKKPANGISVAVTLILAIMIIYFLIVSLIPQVIDSIVGLVNSFPTYVTTAQEWAETKLVDQPEILGYLEDGMSSIETYFNNWVNTELLGNIKDIVGSVTTSVATIFGVFKTIFISTIVAAYVLIARKKFVQKFRLYLQSILKEKQFSVVWEELKFTDRMFSGFISGKIIDSAIIGLLTFVVLSIWKMISGFEYVLLISVVIGVTNIIPFFGPFIGAVPCAFLLLLGNPMDCVGFIIFIIILQQVDGNILGPKILGNTTGISSFGVLFAVLFFGSIWGFVGMLIGVPVFGVLSDIAGKMIEKGLRHNGKEELADLYAEERRKKLEEDNQTKTSDDKLIRCFRKVRKHLKEKREKDL